MIKRYVFVLCLLAYGHSVSAQCDCVYPILFLHGFTGSADTFSGTIADPDFENIWGERADIFHAVLNATDESNIWGLDGIPGNSDDDVLVSFNNLTNDLAPGCIYSINFQNFWNEDESNPEILIDDCSAPSFFDNDSNESAIKKQGYALGHMIDKVLAANPTKDKVIVVGHSMGGLTAREYLQRTEEGVPQWWINGDHNMKKLITTATPHRGSNFFGNPWPLQDEKDTTPTRDGLPDINSEAVRDLRYSYSCNIIFSCPGIYLFGGDEGDLPFGYWNDDVNCDGDEDDIVVGLNESGNPDPWDGTQDNPDMPLPTDVQYTWITSDVGTSGDLVVDLSRQYIYDGAIPVPSNGTAYQLTDTLLTDVQHLSVDDELNTIVRAIDEGDYPIYAWDIDLGNANPYFGVCNYRSTMVPDGGSSQDPDWFSFDATGVTDKICISITPNADLSGSIDFFGANPGDYTTMSSNAVVSESFNTGSGEIVLEFLPGEYEDGINYVRVLHENITSTSWKTAYKIELSTKLIPDLSCSMTMLPTNISGVTDLVIIADVVEVNGASSAGPITVILPKDNKLAISFDNSITGLGPFNVNNADWSYDSSNSSFHIFTSTATLNPNGISVLGLNAIYDPQSTSGIVPITVTIFGGSGSEINGLNNVDSETLSYSGI